MLIAALAIQMRFQRRGRCAAVQQAKVAAGVADNRRDRLSIGKIPIWVNDPQLQRLARADRNVHDPGEVLARHRTIGVLLL
jgi:hypothetical protein